LRLQGAKAFALGPNPDYAKAVGKVTGTLNTSVAADRQQLAAARTPAVQARVAAALAGDYRTAATAMHGLSVSAADQAAKESIVAAMRATSPAYTKLASAAKRGDKTAYANAQTAVADGERSVGGAVAGLRALGYAPG